MIPMGRFAERGIDRTDEVVAQLSPIARRLTSDHDLDPPMDRIGDSPCVLLGEASHGTHKLYAWHTRLMYPRGAHSRIGSDPFREPSPAAALASALLCAPSRDASPVHLEPIMRAELAVHVEATTISLAHWGRLLDGELFATSRYIERAVPMKRSFGFNALTCPRRERKMHVLATITQPSTIRRILEHLGLRAEPLTAAPARDPTWEQVDLGFDDDAA
ncbi:uncharacterized protein SOCE26_032330 [Sorangium cellulosum]|uniref:Uncharacterized protein n=1 Tax=Sorangium cellulosum TaxID=56 RepID=A0A2L0ER61_SORCE|nr:hypothetical protein [Sorangium cellulosum]AUX41808.1 uncharacterized protein SOCE26_032330 [Sorangium cellulosum]